MKFAAAVTVAFAASANAFAPSNVAGNVSENYAINWKKKRGWIGWI